MTFEMKLELVVVPVSDVDRAKDFYINKIGFHLDHDVYSPDNTMRVVQLTPVGSGCSIFLGTGKNVSDMQAGSVKMLHLVVKSVAQVRDTLIQRGVDVGELIEYDGGRIKYAGFSDPDGNSWLLQEINPKS
jgi:catechol 2,3-dioxygenase-like lactoylglutathione lyase family enzyme